MKINVKAFFFNAQTDYLPYYKYFTLELDGEATAKDMLAAIQEQNEMFEYPKIKLIFKVNGLMVTAKEKVKDIVDALGTEILIDPASSYRSKHGLRINDDDFMQSYALLEPYCTEEDLKYFKTLYALHYASETSQYQREYIGDAVLVLAHKLISEGSEHKEQILKAITEADSGLLDCEYENNLFDAEEHGDQIEALKVMLKPEKGKSIFDLLLAKITGQEEAQENEIDYHIKRPVKDIHGEAVAYYSGDDVISNDMDEEIAMAGAKRIHFSMENKRSGFTLLESNKSLAYTKAGTILLDALDSGAQSLVVENEKDYWLFAKHLKSIECAVNRDINLDFVLAEDLVISNDRASA
ncbi:MAG TPA: hypothetical protein ENK72_01315 [Epsilonproteobacteria bacterium]|nr:hypothetical protein [Campylobacterota bacterium]